MLRVLIMACWIVQLGFSWWDFGHVMVARIAYEDLAFSNMTSILDEAVDMALYGSELSPNMTRTFEGVSLWADDVKTMQNIHIWDSWHFIDLPILQDGTPVTPENNPNNALKVIQDALDVLMVPETHLEKTVEKASLLRFLIHLVGDVHQPLHTTTYYSNKFKKGDRGGNLVQISWTASHTDTIKNLHALWDAVGGLFPPVKERPLSQGSLDLINSKALEAMFLHPRTEFEKQLKDKNIAHWIKASYALARDKIYPAIFKNNNVIDEDLQRQTYEMGLRQIALAGYRLADLMKSIFRPDDNEERYRVSFETSSKEKQSVLQRHLAKAKAKRCH
eukprot:TRINITY_DN13039_c0_g1_i1.p1 TRINITY_DN13039_c0_g1~~TRINITY_DN13039_c0_g1_i1.p1  ORF type:complete len:333 (+),score=61.18 TRINITY_DN13039_c0_g1_i1:121-1119(+)